MKSNLESWIIGLALLAGVHQAVAQDTTASAAQGRLNAGSNPALNPALATQTAAIPLDQIGAVTGKQYSGDGLAVEFNPDGARLRCSFQKLNAQVTTEGLWLASAADGATGERFRVIARTLSRESAETLPPTGKVVVAGQVARFIRPGLTEECSVSVAGVRQDFVIERRPEGTGLVRLDLEVDGAKAETMGNGARLVLADRGRKLVYNRLKAEDARGNEVKASMKVMSANRLTVELEDTAAEYPVRIDPTFSDANWISMNPGVPGADNPVSAAVVDSSGNLYVGGNFTLVGDVVANGIAKWDGTSWSALGSGMNLQVAVLAVSGTKLYAGGYFTKAGGSPANYIAQWDGSSWSALGSGMGGKLDSYVVALAVSGSDVYAGGGFTTAGGIAATNIAHWNGSSWTALGSGINGANAVVSALAVSGSSVYAGGIFTTAGGIAATNIAQWNGSSWSALGSGLDISVDALAVSGSDVYAAGALTIGKWNGSSWSALASGFDFNVHALAVSGTNLYAGGSFKTLGGIAATNIARWNGSSWSALSSGVGGTVSALAVSGAHLYAGGSFTTAGGSAANNIAQWDGSTWTALAAVYGMNRQVLALAVSGTNLYAGGQFTTTGNGTTNNYIAGWNGNSWTALGSGMGGPVPGMGGQVLALAVSGTNLYAGGQFKTAGGSAVKDIARWDGSTWSALGLGVAGASVNALAVSGTNLYVGGSFTTAGGIAATNIAQWNGSTWSALGPGLGGGFAGTSLGVYALAVLGTNLYAGGNFTTAGGIAATNVAKWDGSNWTALGSGMGPTYPSVVALAVSGTNLYAGGVFTTANGIAANYIAKWDGSSWTALGSGLNSTVYTLAASGSDLYVGGNFTTAAGSAANYIAKWDGSSWTTLGSGLNSPVVALAVSGNYLYAGGYFGTAGGKVSPYIARANLLTLPTASLIFAGANVIVKWPTNATGFTLQSTTNLISPAGWITNSPAPVVVNGQNTVTNPIFGTQKFYRLIQ